MASKKTESNKNYGEMREELDHILFELQQSEFDIDAAVEKYERGLVLVKELEAYLKTAENKVSKLKADLGS